MIYAGQASIDYLAAEISKDDSGASSYWQKYHSTFRFLGDRFEGLQAFGRSEKPYRGLRLALHRLFQRKYRRMGIQFPQFPFIDTLAYKITSRQGRAYDIDTLRQSLTLAFLKNHVPNALSPQATTCVIGDGFASMTALLLASGSASRIVLINLTKTLLVDIWYLKLWMGAEAFESSVDLVTDEDSLAHALAKPATNEAGGGAGGCYSGIGP